MKKNTQKKNSPDYEAEIINVIMASDTILHVDWIERLALFLETKIDEESDKKIKHQRRWYGGLVILLAIISIGWCSIYGKCTHKHFDEVQNTYDSEICKKDTSRVGRIIMDNQRFNAIWEKTVKK